MDRWTIPIAIALSMAIVVLTVFDQPSGFVPTGHIKTEGTARRLVVSEPGRVAGQLARKIGAFPVSPVAWLLQT
jgi:hypothetical protein